MSTALPHIYERVHNTMSLLAIFKNVTQFLNMIPCQCSYLRIDRLGQSTEVGDGSKGFKSDYLGDKADDQSS